MPDKPFYESLMQELLSKVNYKPVNCDIPVAAAILNSENQLVALKTNLNIKEYDSTAHAEINAIREVCQKIRTSRLDGFSLIVTLEPCLMCAGAIVQSKINKVVFGAFAPKTGFMSSLYPTIKEYVPQIEIVGGILESECSSVMTDWFNNKR